MDVQAYKLLDQTECYAVADEVAALAPFWVNRGWGWTLGAATYCDTPEVYPAYSRYCNLVLQHKFSDLYKRVFAQLETVTGKEVKVLDGTAYPSFHVFTADSNGFQGHPHIDEPFKRIKWPSHISSPFSFTMAVALPECGGGMGYWPDATDEQIEAFIKSGDLPEPKLFDYELGTLYVHDGMTPHRIESYGDMKHNEARITLQGHGVSLWDSVAVYF